MSYRDCDAKILLEQIGKMNVMAISGGPWLGRRTGVTLPVGHGYAVEIDLNFMDFYDVKRVYYPNDNERVILGEVTDIDAFNIGEIAYQASCFVNVPFGGHDCKNLQQRKYNEFDDLGWFKRNDYVKESAK